MTTKRKIHIAFSWLLVVICMGIIFSLSAQSGEESSELSDSFVMALLNNLGIKIDEGILRSIAHCLEFMGLSVLLFNAIYVTWFLKLTPIVAFFSTVLYAITDEIHQIFVPDRAFQISDILVDSTGALIGVIASFVILKLVLYIKGKMKNGNIKTV